MFQSFTSVSYFRNVVTHDPNGLIDFMLDVRSLVSAGGWVGGSATTGKIRVIRFRPMIMQSKRMTRRGREM